MRRAKGEILTGATYLRRFVTTHPEYKQDSVLSDRISYDLIAHIMEMNDRKDRREAFL